MSGENFGDRYPLNYFSSIQAMLDGMSAPTRQIAEMMNQMTKPTRQLQGMLEAARPRPVMPILPTQNYLLEAIAQIADAPRRQLVESMSEMVLGPQRQAMEALSKAFNVTSNAYLVKAFNPVLQAAAISVPAPDVSYLASLGSLAREGAFSAEYVEAAQSAVSEREGVAEAIDDFSVLAVVSEVFDRQTIIEGTYIFIFATWMILTFIMTGHPSAAEELANLIGLGNLAGAHVVAGGAVRYVDKRLTERESGGFRVDGVGNDQDESGPDPA